MKRFTQFVSLILIASMLLVLPAYATESVTPKSSSFFGELSTYLYKTSSTQFRVWFEVTAVGGMDELGVSYIEVQRSTDKTNWTPMKTYSKDSYSQMIGYNTGNHCNYVTYTATSGYYYRAYVKFYAKNSSGTAYYSAYTSSLQM